MGQLQNYVNNAYENVLTSSSLSSYATTSSLSTVASDLSTLAGSLSNYATKTSLDSYALLTSLSDYASKSVENTFTLLQTFSSGLTSTGVITANGGITATGQPITGGVLSCTTQTATGLISANGGLTVPSGKTLTLTGATITGLNTIEYINLSVNATQTLPPPTAFITTYLFNVSATGYTVYMPITLTRGQIMKFCHQFGSKTITLNGNGSVFCFTATSVASLSFVYGNYIEVQFDGQNFCGFKNY
jgi:hypothetical protein